MGTRVTYRKMNLLHLKPENKPVPCLLPNTHDPLRQTQQAHVRRYPAFCPGSAQATAVQAGTRVSDADRIDEDPMQDHREALIQRSIELLDAIKERTAGTQVERWLNRTYGPDSALFQALAELVTHGVRAGWAANEELDGAVYRRSRIAAPSERTHYFSITAVYMDSGSAQNTPDHTYRGQYHTHTYGEFNMVVPLDPGAALMGPDGWCEAGWTAPAPGSHHYPEARGGRVIALFYLPAGRIVYGPPPDEEAEAP
ncbi:DUF4863 family protein [Xanthomonas codiaei]|uniref:DUF4863 family protein n=2 Tax=Xanthomonas codiaei TaxID=56463 RepID=A0ABW9MSQ9_9XANT|nr:DUF4863 family protein [Xanthomonas codiaei]